MGNNCDPSTYLFEQLTDFARATIAGRILNSLFARVRPANFAFCEQNLVLFARPTFNVFLFRTL
jgi:hypothetical protein